MILVTLDYLALSDYKIATDQSEVKLPHAFLNVYLFRNSMVCHCMIII